MAGDCIRLTAVERGKIELGLRDGLSLTAIAAELWRPTGTMSKEIPRNGGRDTYDAGAAHIRMENAPRGGRRNRLSPGEPLFEAVACLLRKRWSPEQIAGRRKRMEGGVEASSGLSVSHETIYQAIHALPRGELKKELLTCFRQDKPHRGRRSKVDEKRGKICNMASIHSRPGEIEGRLVPGHWEGDLIKGAANRSSVGTLVERTSGKVVLIKLTDAKASTTRDGFVEGMLRIPAPLRLTMTYDQGKEMARHRELAVATGIRVYFADPHSPWQRVSNENVNGLLRQYPPKGADLTKFAQAHLDGIAADLNSRPRKRHNYATPDEVFDALLDKAANAEHAGNGSGVSFGTSIRPLILTFCPTPAETLARLAIFCWAASMICTTDAALSAFMRIIIAAAASCMRAV